MPPHALAVRYTPAVLVPGKWGGRAHVRDEVQQYDKIVCQSISTHTHTREKMSQAPTVPTVPSCLDLFERNEMKNTLRKAQIKRINIQTST